jgi:uncharacterized protein DUF4255
MSTALAIGAVSAVLRNILDNGVIDAVPAVGSPVTVTVRAPDLVKTDDPGDGPQLNLFMYAVSHNQGWRNMSLPSRNPGGDRVSNPPLALNLHYLLTAYGRDDIQAEILLGYAMHLLHERPFLDRPTIRAALQLGPVDSTLVPAAFQNPANAGLADQFETLKITWEALDVDAMSKLWTAIQTHFRPSAAFEVSVVLIDSNQSAAMPLPVLTRGVYDPATRRDAGVAVAPSLIPPYPMLTAASAPDGTAIAELGETITLAGQNLAGTAATVLLAHRLLPAPHEIAVGVSADATSVAFALPMTETAGAIWPAGLWSVTISVIPPGEPAARVTNVVALMLAPVPDAAAAALARDAVTERVSVTSPVRPAIQPEQTVMVAVDAASGPTGPQMTPQASVTADVGLAPPGPATLRVRVDGVESRSFDPTALPPIFRADRQVVVP